MAPSLYLLSVFRFPFSVFRFPFSVYIFSRFTVGLIFCFELPGAILLTFEASNNRFPLVSPIFRKLFSAPASFPLQ